MIHDPWQLYHGKDSIAARRALETAWRIACKMPEPIECSRYMERVMNQYASAGAADSEGYQELNRRMRKIWPDWD